MASIIPATRDQTLAATLAYASQALSQSDPRAVLESLLHAASEVAQLIQSAGRMEPADVAQVYGQSLVDALTTTKQEAPVIQLMNGSRG